MIPSKRKALYFYCMGLGLVTISIHLYFTSGFPNVTTLVRIASWGNDPGSILEEVNDPDSPFLPTPLNYIPPSGKIETVNRYDLDTLLNSPPPDANGYKLIVIHTLNYGEDFLHEGEQWIKNGDFFYGNTTSECPRKCKYSMNRTLAEEAHALMFSILDDIYHTKKGETRYPKKRRADQLWIGLTYEAPLYHNANLLHELGHYFNWTFSYRLNSDVYIPYGYFYKLNNPRTLSAIDLPDKQKLRSKKLAVTLISNCGAMSQRDRVIEAMNRSIPIDHYGRCGKKCPEKGNCRKFLALSYKFFLAFENSLCQDYITEKFFDAITVGMVPVTYGLGDYAEVAPPGSYINALDFPNVTALTDYLKYLDLNDDEYLKYFHWRRYYERGPSTFPNEMCNLCVKLWNAPRNYTQQITNFNDWWNHKRPVPLLENSLQNLTLGARLLRDAKKNCISPKEIFEQGFLS